MRRSRQTFLALLALAPLGLYLACSDDEPAGPTTLSPDASADTTRPDQFVGEDPVPTDSGRDTGKPPSDGGIQRGPASLDFDPTGTGDPISLVWDDGTSTLYIADNRKNQIWKWTDSAGFAKLATVPDDPVATDAGQTNLGQIVRLSDGTLVVPRFGFGQRGAIVHVEPATGDAGTVPGLPLNRRRVALTRGGGGGGGGGGGNQMWGGYFLQGGGNDDAGVVTKVTLTGETDYAGGFQKPVAVIVLDGQLIVSEQTRGLLYALPTDGGAVAPYTV